MPSFPALSCASCRAARAASITLYRRLGGGRAATQRFLKLGVFPALSLTDARAATHIYGGLIAKGDDPAAVRAKAERKSRATLAVLLAESGPYETHRAERGPVNRNTALSLLRRGGCTMPALIEEWRTDSRVADKLSGKARKAHYDGE